MQTTVLLLIQTAIQECALTSLVSMRSVSVCAVSRSVIHVVLRSIPYHNQRVCCLHVLQVTCARPEEKLGFERHFRVTELHAAKVTMCQHVSYADIRILVLTIATYSSYDVTSTQTSSMFFPQKNLKKN